MKRVLFLACALLASTINAQNIKVGGDLLGGLTIPTIGSDMKGTDGVMGWNLHIAPMAQYGINEMFAIEGSIGFAMTQYGTESKLEFMGRSIKSESTIKPMWLEFGIAPVFKINEQAFVSLGYSWAMPLGGTIESGDEEADIAWAGDKPSEKEYDIMSNHSVVLGGGYNVTPALAVIGAARYGFLGLSPKKNDEGTKYDGRQESSKSVSSHEISVGVRYAIGL